MPKNKAPTKRGNPYSWKAWSYAKDCVSGKRLVSETTRNSCQRFLDDFDSDWWFVHEKAERVCKFVEQMPHTKGEWFQRKELLKLEPWQCFVLCNLFGWYGDDGYRRFTEAYIQVARKNGKSLLAACIGLYMFCADGEAGSEVYSGATTEKQALEVFTPARLISQRDSEFKSQYDIEIHAKSLTILASGNVFSPIVGNPGDGQSPHCAIVDEYHEHAKDTLYNTMQTGMAARRQPLLLAITTAGSSVGGPCHEKYDEMVALVKGTYKADHVFALIFEADQSDEWDSDDALTKANPNLHLINRKVLDQQRTIARRMASKQNDFRTKHLNQWVGARTAWMNVLSWRRVKRDFDWSDMNDESCYVAIDLGAKKDVTAMSAVWRRPEGFYTLSKYYVPEQAILEQPKVRDFAADDLMNVTEGEATDYSIVERDLAELARNHDVMSVATDDWQSRYLMQRIQDMGIDVQTFTMNAKNLSAPMKELDAHVSEQKFFHNGDPVLSWMVGNVMAKEDWKGNIYPTKSTKDSPMKIDGVVTTLMAFALWLNGEDPESYTARNGAAFIA